MRVRLYIRGRRIGEVELRGGRLEVRMEKGFEAWERIIREELTKERVFQLPVEAEDYLDKFEEIRARAIDDERLFLQILGELFPEMRVIEY
ncbi:MAG: hypothetical protein DRO18_04270 [Thermoprotei archaeon]|nr:MAG: hypothetical protein DRO18_04270 [Thermoprotei archaeon]